MEELPYLHQPETEPIPGYRLIAPLGRGGFGEVWKCEAPGGLLKAIKFVQGSLHTLDRDAPAEEELRAIQRVKTIRHPFILSMERVEVDVSTGELVIVLELADRGLGDVLAAEREAGRTGIAREVLLAYLREAAEALDVMHVRHGLQHLDIKPQNLFLLSNHVKVGDFGLVQSLSGNGPGGVALGAITPLYAAPEVFQGRISPHSDQYSLAIVYQELLTGTLPFAGKNSRQLMLQHCQGQPNLQPLPEADRPVIARALSKLPEQRFPSCSDFINALASGQVDIVSATVISEPPAPRAAPHAADTRRNRAVKTVRTRSLAAPRPPLPPPAREAAGLHIEELISRTPLTEVWRARAADGTARLVKVLFGCAAPGCEDVNRLACLRHPALLPIDVLQHAPGKLVLVTSPGERSLRDLLIAYQAHGQVGIPRALLLGWLRGIAEALQFLAGQHGLQHLGLNPRNLVLGEANGQEGERLLLADFGLAQLVWLPTGQSIASLNGRYSAPELYRRRLSDACDQYSLALIYHELLTGTFPTPRLARRGEPEGFDLDGLPLSDRVLVARALHPDPRKRWPSPVELFGALQQLAADEAPAAAIPIPAARAPAVDVLKMCFGTTLAADIIRQRLEGFQQQWNARVLTSGEHSLSLQMQTPCSFWQRWTGRQPAMEVHLSIGQPEVNAPVGVQVRTEVRMDVRPRDCSREQSAELIKMVGPLLVESVRQHLSVHPRGRQQERLLWHHPLQMSSIQPDGQIGPPIECQGKDISLNGIGFYLPGALPSAQVMLHLPQTAQTPGLSVPAQVVRVQGCGEGWFEVGAVLLPPHELPPDEEALLVASNPA